MSSRKWRPFCLGLYVLLLKDLPCHDVIITEYLNVLYASQFLPPGTGLNMIKRTKLCIFSPLYILAANSDPIYSICGYIHNAAASDTRQLMYL